MPSLSLVANNTPVPYVVQGVAVNVAVTGGSLTPSLTGIKVGDTLVLSITNTSVTTGQAASGVSGGGAASWILAGTVPSAIGVTDIWIGSNNAGSAGAQTVTVTLNGISAVAGCQLDEIANVSLTNPLDSFASNVGTSTTISSPVMAISETNDVPYYFSNSVNSETASPSNPWTQETGPTTAGLQKNGVAYRLGVSGGTNVSTSWTQTIGAWTVAGVVLNAVDVPIAITAAIKCTSAASITETGGIHWIYPGYEYPTLPGSIWQQVAAYGPGNPPGFVIANPASGPGSGVVADWTTAIANAQAAGWTVMGYVNTSNGYLGTVIPIGTVETQIDEWFTWYGIIDIFFDQCTNNTTDVSYYQSLTNYVRSTHGAGQSVLNMGTVPIYSGYESPSVADALCTFEDPESDYTPTFVVDIFATGVAAAHIVYSSTSLSNMLADVATAVKYQAYYFIATDQSGYTAPISNTFFVPENNAIAQTVGNFEVVAITAAISASAAFVAGGTKQITTAISSSASVAATNTESVPLTSAVVAQASIVVVSNFDSLTSALGPVGWWKLADAGPSTAVDSSGNGHNGSVPSGGVTFGQSPLIVGTETSAIFNGSTGEVTIADTAILDFGTGSFSVGVWFETLVSGGAGVPGLMAKGATSSIVAGWRMYVAAADGTAHGIVRDGTNSINMGSGAVVNDGRPHFVELTVDRTAGFTYIYVDGQQKASNALGAMGSVSNTSFSLFIGSDSANEFPGTLAQVAVFSYALTPAQVSSLYAAGLGGDYESVSLTAAISSNMVFAAATAATPITCAITGSASVAASNTESVAITNAIAASVAVAATNTETIQISSTIVASAAVATTNAENVSVAASISSSLVVAANNGEQISLSAAIGCSSAVVAANTENAQLTSSITTSLALAATINDTDAITASLSASGAISANNAEAVALTCSITSSTAFSANPTIGTTASITASVAISATNTESVALAAAIAANASLSVANKESEALTSAIAPQLAVQGNNQEAVSISCAVSATSALAVADAESTQITGAISSSSALSATNTEKIALTCAITSSVSVSAAATKAVAITGVISASVSTTSVNTEHVALSGAVSASLTINAQTSDVLQLTTAISSSVVLTAVNVEQTALNAAISVLFTITENSTKVYDLTTSISVVSAVIGTISRLLTVGHQSVSLTVQPALVGQQQSMQLTVQPALQ